MPFYAIACLMIRFGLWAIFLSIMIISRQVIILLREGERRKHQPG